MMERGLLLTICQYITQNTICMLFNTSPTGMRIEIMTVVLYYDFYFSFTYFCGKLENP